MQKDFAVASAKNALVQLQYFKKSIYLEASKAGFPLSKKHKKQYLEQVNALQDRVYGPEISEVPEEKRQALEATLELFHANKDRLSDSQKAILGAFFEKFDIDPNVTVESQNASVSDERKKRELQIKNTFLPEEDFVAIIRDALDLYGLHDWQVDVSEKATMFSVKADKKIMTVPQSKISSTSLFRLLQLLDHEIGVHAIR